MTNNNFFGFQFHGESCMFEMDYDGNIVITDSNDHSVIIKEQDIFNYVAERTYKRMDLKIEEINIADLL